MKNAHRQSISRMKYTLSLAGIAIAMSGCAFAPPGSIEESQALRSYDLKNKRSGAILIVISPKLLSIPLVAKQDNQPCTNNFILYPEVYKEAFRAFSSAYSRVDIGEPEDVASGYAAIIVPTVEGIQWNVLWSTVSSAVSLKLTVFANGSSRALNVMQVASDSSPHRSWHDCAPKVPYVRSSRSAYKSIEYGMNRLVAELVEKTPLSNATPSHPTDRSKEILDLINSSHPKLYD